MKAGLSTKNAPSPNVVLPHYVFGALAFIAASVMLFFASDDIVSLYIGPKVLGIVHVLVLGWITMIIYGALYQLIPVVMEVKLYSEILAYISFFTLGLGTILMAISFWYSYILLTILIEIGATLVIVSTFLFAINAIKSSLSSSQRGVEIRFIVTSVFWLLLTILLGIFIILNTSYSWIGKSNVELLKIHANFGIIGWFMMLVIGVASKLLPMFFIAHKLKIKYLHYSYYLSNLGLVAISIVYTFYPNEILLLLLYIVITLGIIFFIKYNYDAYKARLRKKLDIGLKLSVFSFILLFLTIIFGFISFLSPDFMGSFNIQFSIAYGISLILGFFTSLILGQMYKTLPFIVWLQKYQDKVGKYKIPMPADMYSVKLANAHYYTYVPAILSLIIAVFAKCSLLVQISAGLFLLTSVLYAYNTFMIVYHKDISKPL